MPCSLSSKASAPLKCAMSIVPRGRLRSASSLDLRSGSRLSARTILIPRLSTSGASTMRIVRSFQSPPQLVTVSSPDCARPSRGTATRAAAPPAACSRRRRLEKSGFRMSSLMGTSAVVKGDGNHTGLTAAAAVQAPTAGRPRREAGPRGLPGNEAETRLTPPSSAPARRSRRDSSGSARWSRRRRTWRRCRRGSTAPRPGHGRRWPP